MVSWLKQTYPVLSFAFQLDSVPAQVAITTTLVPREEHALLLAVRALIAVSAAAIPLRLLKMSAFCGPGYGLVSFKFGGHRSYRQSDVSGGA
jgi:hypothetical protein